MGKYSKHIFALSAGLVCFIVYLLTLHPGVAFVDCGELAAACYTFGIPHPTGYPLFLVIGYLFSHIPVPGSVIYKLNLLTAIETAIAVVIAFYASLNLLREIARVQVGGKQSKKTIAPVNLSENSLFILSFFTALVFGLVGVIWFYATQIEVYALQTFFISLILYFAIRILLEIKSSGKKLWAGLILTLGFSFANHSTTIYFIPGALYLFYLQNKANPVFVKSLYKYVMLLIPGALMYLILIFRASEGPYLNWSNPGTFSGLWDHVRGHDFSQLMFSSSSGFFKTASEFFSNFPQEMAYLPALFSVFGLFGLYKANKNTFTFFVLIIIPALLVSFNYDTIEIQSFYLPVYCLMALCAGVGAIYVLKFWKKSVKFAESGVQPAVIALGILMLSFSLGVNYRLNDNSGNYVNEDITLNTLNNVEPNSIILAYDWAFLYSTSLYFQQVEHTRGDVKVFNVKFLSSGWYLDMIKKYYPDVYANIKTEADDYEKFSASDENTRLSKLTTLVMAFFKKNLGKFPLYATFDLVYSKDMKEIVTDYLAIPDGLVYRIKEKNSAYDPVSGAKSLNYVFRKYEPVGYHKNKMFVATSGLYYDNAAYHYSNKNYEQALKFLDKALELNKDMKDALNLKNRILNENKTK